MQFSDAIRWRHNKSKMVDGRHIENRFLAISRRHIGRSTRNLAQRCRITCRYRSRDQNCNFRKFKMADGRHFENSIISISQPWINRFRLKLVGRCTFKFPWWSFNKKIEILQIQDGGRTPYWKSFLAISRRHISRFMQISKWRWRITCRYQSLDKKGNFRKLKMADGRHFENSFISISLPWIIRFRSNLLHADANFHSEHGNLTKNRNFSNSRWRTDAILKIVFWLYLGAMLADQREMKNHMPIQVTWPKLQFSKIQDGGRPPFWKQFSLFTSFL